MEACLWFHRVVHVYHGGEKHAGRQASSRTVAKSSHSSQLEVAGIDNKKENKSKDGGYTGPLNLNAQPL